MGSAHHPHWILILQSVERTVDNTIRNGGIVPAALEARRLAKTYPDAGMSEADIVAEFVRVGAERSVLVDVDGAAERLSSSQDAETRGDPPATGEISEPVEVRKRIWERIRASAGDPLIIDARGLAREVLAEFPASGLGEGQLVHEFQRIRRVFRSRSAEDVRPEG